MFALIFALIVNFLNTHTLYSQAEESKPLLRVFPIYRIEECEWAIRMDICHYCIRKGERYAQKIYFLEDKPYRVHGCFSQKKGFYAHEFPDLQTR
jgi:hypothetical protein